MGGHGQGGAPPWPPRHRFKHFWRPFLATRTNLLSSLRGAGGGGGGGEGGRGADTSGARSKFSEDGVQSLAISSRSMPLLQVHSESADRRFPPSWVEH